MSIVPFRKKSGRYGEEELRTMATAANPAEVKRIPLKTTKEEALRLEYIEYRKWRNLIHDEIMAYKKKGGSYKTISARTGLCVSTISKLAYGETTLPRMETVYRVLRYLGYRLYVTKM